MSKPTGDASEAGKTLSRLGASKGGKARAAGLTPKQRSDIAQKAVNARWAKAKGSEFVPSGVLRVACGSPDQPMRIAGFEIPCYVLEDKSRVITHRGLQKSLGMPVKGGATETAGFIAQFERKGIACKDLVARLSKPKEFLPLIGGRSAFAYDATILADICEVVLSARAAGLLTRRQGILAEHCEILVRAFARTGIIALVDEATGYQEVRAKDDLAKILEAFIAKELQAYIDVFPSGFYQELFRLRGLAFPRDSVKRPQYFGILTNDIVYKRLAPGVLDELKRVTPRRPSSGAPKHRFYQRLTSNLGFPKLKEHLGSVVTIMRLSKNWPHFIELLDQLHPRYGDTRRLNFPEYDASQDSGSGL